MGSEDYQHNIVDAFNSIADNAPHQKAVAAQSGGKWSYQSYRQLREKSIQIADTLLDAGLQPGDPVILPAVRHPDLCACLLGILSCGGHYVFLDPGYPRDRQQLILANSGAKLGLASEGAQTYADLQLRWLPIPTEPPPESDAKLGYKSNRNAESTTYIVFTSGSTGTPKGVLVPDRAVIRLVRDADYIEFSPQEGFLQHSSLSFDASTLEIWGPLLNGGLCVIHPENQHVTPAGIGQSIVSQAVSTLWLTSSFFNTMITEHPDYLAPVSQLLVGGEALSVPHIRKALEYLPDTRLFNGYGPTENTTFTTVYPIPESISPDTKRIPIGFPVNGTFCDVFDENLRPVTGDHPQGELIAFGAGLATGYLNKPELTREKFRTFECRDGITRTGYRTGDLVVRLPDGSYDYLQRLDNQVKIDGQRIEPGEIEYTLNRLENVDEARVAIISGPAGQKRIAAYYVSRSGVSPSALRNKLADALPAFMVPHFFIAMDHLPKNKNGKLDETALPDPFAGNATSPGVNSTVSQCWQDILGRSIGDSVNFLDAGGTSLEAMRLTEKLSQRFSCSLKPTFVFEYPTIAAQGKYFSDEPQNTATNHQGYQAPSKNSETGFAVIGLACRFPGANNAREFWKNLLEGKESIEFFSPDALSPDVDRQQLNDPRYVPAKGIIQDCDQFDAEFFRIPPQEALVMDPQQRLLMELAWHALEDGGYGENGAGYRTGVFAGTNWPRYFQQYVLPNRNLLAKVGAFNASLANESDFVSSRIAYKLNLTGPAVNVFTACSTGLVAIAQACAAIEQGQCELALAGGASISTPVNSGYLYQEGGMLSRDGHCRPFDASATGTTFNDGAGMVLIKRLDLAIRDKDPIYGVVKGYAINNDGENKASFSAPSVSGQVAVYRDALQHAHVDPANVEFIETHGTATPLGDPIEIEALNQVYGAATDAGEPGSHRCAIGSVKSNIGHTIHAAGIASFIKSILSVKHGVIPGTLFYKTPNPKLGLEQTPFYVNRETVPWKSTQKRVAAVSSLGVGGTNAHVLIENFSPASDSLPDSSENPQTGAMPLLLSAKSKESLEKLTETYVSYLGEQGNSVRAIDAGFTSALGRKPFDHRLMVTGSNPDEFAQALCTPRLQAKGIANRSAQKRLGFLFSGQGSQRSNMGAWLYHNDEDFRQQFDAGCEIVKACEGFDIRSVVFGENSPQIGLDIHQTKVAQPALFLIEYGVATYLMRHGCRPDFFIGHSIGEYAAACIAGVFSFEEAVTLVARRGALMQSVPSGCMLTVKLSEADLQPFLSDEVNLAAVNAPDHCVLAGPQSAINNVRNMLEEQGINSKILKTSHAFHSSMMDPIMADFREAVKLTIRRAPDITLYSSMSGARLSAEEAQSVDYWVSQIRQPVRFSAALSSAAGQTEETSSGAEIGLLEVGPGNALTALVGFHELESVTVSQAVLLKGGEDENTGNALIQGLGVLWCHGFDINWHAFFQSLNGHKENLPGYAFNRKRFWLGSEKLPHTQDACSEQKDITDQGVVMSQQNPSEIIREKLIGVFEEVTGYDLSDMDPEAHFSESGLDSLLLTQVATAIEAEYQIGLTFRHLVENYSSLNELIGFVVEKAPPAIQQETSPNLPSQGSMPDTTELFMAANTMNGTDGSLQSLINAQLQIMQLQLQALSGKTVDTRSLTGASQTTVNPVNPDEKKDSSTETKAKPRHTPGTRISKEKLGIKLTKAQQQWLDEKMAAYQKKYAGSKAYTQNHRKHLADPRSVSGFNPEWKEIVFPIVTSRSKGSKLWDIDGNELIDLSNGFGPILFGHSPDFVTEAVKQQLDQGIETGPQSPLTGEVAELFCELTGNERCGFASTGSEAVIGAIRLARTVTGRKTVVMFEGSYHGIFDEVINRPGRDYQALPAAPGIPKDMTSNMLVLPWEPESLEVLRSLGKDIAAVLVESVQSRKPEFHDKEFLQGLRKITSENDSALIFDEVVTGFRVHPGGMRKLFNIDCDIATYGKVVGGGYPIGIIGGKARFLDALDGGQWQYGDDSIPECGVTFFAGTFVRHPVALAAAKAIMTEIKSQGTALYDNLEKSTSELSRRAQDFIAEMKCQVTFESFASLFYVAVPANAHWGHMLFLLMTLDGIHIQQYRPCFLTTCHDEKDQNKILEAFRNALAELISHGLIEGDSVAANKYLKTKAKQIPEGARLGRNANGEPAYFVEDPDRKGKYIEVGKP